MAQLNLDIANRALIRLGLQQISSFSDSKQSAVVLNSHFQDWKKELLRSHPWNFAIDRNTLHTPDSLDPQTFEISGTTSTTPVVLDLLPPGSLPREALYFDHGFYDNDTVYIESDVQTELNDRYFSIKRDNVSFPGRYVSLYRRIRVASGPLSESLNAEDGNGRAGSFLIGFQTSLLNYNDTGDNGTFYGGTAIDNHHAVDDEITLSNNAVVKVTAVNGDEQVTAFTVIVPLTQSGSDTTLIPSSHNQTYTQTSTTGTVGGTGGFNFSLTPKSNNLSQIAGGTLTSISKSEWSYSYDLPNDVLRVLGVDDLANGREFVVESTGIHNQKAILCNISNKITIKYLVDVDLETRDIDYNFAEVLSLKIAMKLSELLIKTTSVTNEIQNEYIRALSHAKSLDAQEGSPTPDFHSTWADEMGRST